MLNLAVCDRRSGAVLEMTPKTVVLRRGEDGICVCTNHFRTSELALFKWCRRYGRLVESQKTPKIDPAYVAGKMDEVNQGRMTVQTMVFEPVPLVLHLGIGECPSSSQPLRRIDLAPLFAENVEDN